MTEQNNPHAQLARTHEKIAQEGSGSMRAGTPEDIARSQRFALAEGSSFGITTDTVARRMAEQVLTEDEEVNPAGVIVERYIEAGDEA